jgi:hypothetical protein
MHEAPSVLSAWSNFYVITGSSAAALTGLMFVVITLVAGDRSRAWGEGISTFSSPTVVHFCVALLVSAILTAPWHSLGQVGVMLGLTGLYGVAYTLLIVYRLTYRIRREAYRPQVEDWLSYAIVPLVGYVAIAGAAIGLPAVPAAASFALAGATVLLIFVGIRNAWDVVTFIAIGPIPEPDDPDRDQRA